ncbi:MAG TPA: bacteriohemerythrin [Desulfomonilia bacterium]|nr:bacteriohemerythrin [Desulfomonilia bacterium]
MHQIEWKDEYLTDVDEIDLQHKSFVKLINRLNIVHDFNNKKAIAIRILSEIEKYAQYHFISEENIMFLTRYPAIDRQQQAHAALLDEFIHRVQSYMNDKGTIEDIIIFLEAWFVRHTVEEDKKIGTYIKDTKKKHTGS